MHMKFKCQLHFLVGGKIEGVKSVFVVTTNSEQAMKIAELRNIGWTCVEAEINMPTEDEYERTYSERCKEEEAISDL